jgi:hypothetical protein
LEALGYDINEDFIVQNSEDKNSGSFINVLYFCTYDGRVEQLRWLLPRVSKSSFYKYYMIYSLSKESESIHASIFEAMFKNESRWTDRDKGIATINTIFDLYLENGLDDKLFTNFKDPFFSRAVHYRSVHLMKHGLGKINLDPFVRNYYGHTARDSAGIVRCTGELRREMC